MPGRNLLAEPGRNLLAPEPSKKSAFVGPIPEFGVSDIPKGAADIGISSLRSLVNKPAATLSGLLGAVNPNDTYATAKDRYRQAAASDSLIVKDDRLRTPQGSTLAALLSALPKPMLPGGTGPLAEAAFSAPGNLGQMVAGEPGRDVAESVTMLASLRTPRSAMGEARSPLTAARAPLTAESIASRSATGGSVGAAAAATNLTGITPELRQAVTVAGLGGRRVNPEVLSRHVEADTLPVPVRLTAGEATQNPVLLSRERNLRGRHPEMVQRMDETNKALGQNLNAIRDDVGQNVFSTNAVEHGDSIIAAYKARDAVAEKNIKGLYDQLRAAAGGNIPVDAPAVLGNATAALHRKLLFDFAPPEIMRTLNRLAENNSMTFENFESLRTNLARISRSAQDGNVRAAAGVIRSELENLPLTAGAERLKPIADAARNAARQRFMALEADPAYEAAVNETVPPDRFVQKFVIGAPRDQLAVMSNAFRNDPTVRQTIGVAVLDHLRDAARLDSGYAGNFSASGFSRALQTLDPKTNLIFDPKTAETLGKLRNVANYTTIQPRGSFVNNSNTLVASLADNAGRVAEGAINYGTMGLGAPLGAAARKAIGEAPERRLIRDSLRRGAGLGEN